MRAAVIVFLLLCLSGTGLCQQSNGNPTTISGCLMSLNGAFTLLTPKGERFVLKGDHDTLFSYNGKQVKITGTPKSTNKNSGAPKPGEFRVSDVKKIADTCQ
jgi:hypothetical protein